ncbi:hypothetical protein P8452_60632 [Trifolium repens]|nr:hypothetical protein P8452_60632 [Trifolium repens]
MKGSAQNLLQTTNQCKGSLLLRPSIFFLQRLSLPLSLMSLISTMISVIVFIPSPKHPFFSSQNRAKSNIKKKNYSFRGFLVIKHFTKDVSAKELVLKMIVDGPLPGNAVFNFVITGYSQVVEMGKAVEMFRLL